MEEGMQSFHSFSQHLQCSPTQELSKPCLFWGFWRLHYVDMIKSLTVGD